MATMKLFLNFHTIWAALLVLTVRADVDLAQTCQDASGAWHCDEFDYPYGAQTVYCQSGGTSKACGIKILTQKKTICQAIIDGMPGNSGQTFLDALNPICGCLGSMKNDDTMTRWDPVIKYGEINRDITYNEVYAFDFIDTCISGTLIFSTGDNRDGVISDVIDEAGYSVVLAADITIVTYQNFIQIYEQCTNDCEAQYGDFFDEYVHSSYGITDGDLYYMLDGWKSLFNSISTKTSTLSKTSSSVQSHRSTASTSVDKTKASICKNNACTGSTQKTFLQQVSDAFTAVKALSAYTQVADSAHSAQAGVNSIITSMITDTTTAVPGSVIQHDISELIIAGLEDFIYGFPIATSMPQHASDIKTAIIPIIVATKYQTQAATANAKLNTVLATDWSKKTTLPKTVRDGFTSIQNTMKKELQTVLKTLSTQMKDLDDNLNKFQLRKHAIEWRVGGTPYQRFTANNLELPCLTTKTKTFTLSGYTASMSYPTFSSCAYGPDLIYLPNRHIPWIKWRFY